MTGVGKAYVLSSGQKLTAAFAYTAKYTTRNFRDVALSFELVEGGSGCSYTIRGYPVEGLPALHHVTSGTVLLSGVLSYVQLSGTYDQIDVGLTELQTNESGSITVYVTGKRR